MARARQDGALADRDWGLLVSQEHFVELPLPDAARWEVERNGPWLRARHVASHSALELRTWREARGTTVESCERSARLGRPDLPAVRAEAGLEDQVLDVPDGFRTRLSVGIAPRPDGSIVGFALAFGAGVRRCLAVVFTTETRGSQAERRVAARLALIVNQGFRRLSTRGVVDRAPRRDPFEF